MKPLAGEIDKDVSQMVISSLQLPLHTALHRAKKEHKSISYSNLKIEQSGVYYNYSLKVIPPTNRAKDFYLAKIEQKSPIESSKISQSEEFKTNNEAPHRILELEEELQYTRENLQALIEELETTNEEQQATNEELTASNEELQSTNEELHSVNEELYTVNAEYQSKIEELIELNNDIDNLLRSTDIGVVFLDRDLRIRKFTPAATIAINLVLADIDRPIEHITHNLNCPGFVNFLNEVVESQKVFQQEVKLVKQDFHLLMRINPYLIEDGSLDGLVITFVDVDELKTIQQQIHLVNEELKTSQFQLRQLNHKLEERVEERTQALQQSETRLRAILDTTSSVIYLKDVEGRYLLANKQYFNLFDLNESKILGKSDRDIFPQEVANLLIDHDRQVLETKKILKVEEQVPIADGKLRTYISNKAPLIDEHGEVYAVCGISTDISQQKQVEVELRASAARESTVLKIVQKIRQSLDLVEIFQTTTQELRETLKCDRVVTYRFNPDWSGEFIAESVAEGYPSLLGSNIQTGWTDTCLQETKGGRYSTTPSSFVVNDIEQAGLTRCHKEIYQKIQARAFCITPIFQGEKLWGLLAAYQNSHPRKWIDGETSLLTQTGIQLGISISQVDLFTQIQVKKAAEIAGKAKDIFISRMSHELRTPLNSILGFSDLLKKELIGDSEKLHSVDIINQAGQHLLALIEDILDFSRISAKKLELQRSEFNLIQFLNEVASIFQIQVKQGGLKFCAEILPSVPIAVSLDKVRLRQVLLNLLSNAFKFTETGKVTLKVGAVNDFMVDKSQQLEASNNNNSHSSSKKIRFQVEDTGRGIPDSELESIFTPFSQIVDNKNKHEGTGLGLSISRDLIRLMRGDIQVVSKINQGSRFWFDLEIPEIAVDLLPASTKPVVTMERKLNVPCKILVVDDNDDNRSLLVKYLQSMGFTLKSANNGREALAIAETFEPEAILTDLAMPIMDGREMIAKIKQQAHLQNIVIIAISANSQFILEASEINCHDFLSKPVDLSRLLDLLDTHLQLDWQLSKSTPETDRLSSIAAPEQQDLLSLLEAVQIGDLEGIESQIKFLETRNDRYLSFAEEVRQLTQSFQLDRLEQFIQQFCMPAN